MGNFHETRNDLKHSLCPDPFTFICFSSFRSLCPPLLQTSPALTKFKNLFGLRCLSETLLAEWPPCPDPAAQCHSVNKQQVPSVRNNEPSKLLPHAHATETPLPGWDYQRPVNVGKTPDFMSRLLLFIPDYHRGIPWRDRSKKAPNTWSLCNEAAMQRAKTTHAWENKLKQFPWNLNPA